MDRPQIQLDARAGQACETLEILGGAGGDGG